MIPEERNLEKLKAELGQLGPLLPGSISEQWNVCGTIGCKCKDTEKPQKHGPYYQLSFTVGGKSSTMFIKKENLKTAHQFIKNHKKFKTLNTEVIKAHVALIRKIGFNGE